jgi:biopolymer transport protein ExbB
MQFLIDAYEAIRDFLELGGPVLRLIAVVILIMWVLILERLIYFRTGLQQLIKDAFAAWEGRPERKSWYAHQIRQRILSQVRIAANQGLPMIQTLVALCPLLGLLGTVTGMVTVFEVMAVTGSSNARSMASGVSMATIPTMAGMVGALSGVFLVTVLTRSAKRRVGLLEDELTMDH